MMESGQDTRWDEIAQVWVAAIRALLGWWHLVRTDECGESVEELAVVTWAWRGFRMILYREDRQRLVSDTLDRIIGDVTVADVEAALYWNGIAIDLEIMVL